ncbi:MAG: zinc-binding dehydrogenase, partial [Pseudomonadota bacterium]
ATPRPGPGDVVVRVRAAAVNNTDVNTRLAWYSKGDGDAADASWSGVPLRFPLIQGIDGCGEIAAVGEGVPASRLGARVLIEPCLREAGGAALTPPWFLGSECDGTFAQYVRVASRHAHDVESGWSDEVLATFPCSWSTAENMLTRAGLREGERVLITGASGGVGSAAVQLARARGAEVIALTSPDKAEALREAGAALTVDRTAAPAEALGADVVDVVIDLVAGDGFAGLLDVLRRGGRYAVAGAVGGPVVPLDVRTLYLKDLSFFGCTALDHGVFAALIRRIEREEVRPMHAVTFPLQRMREAQAAFAAKTHVGKIALSVP